VINLLPLSRTPFITSKLSMTMRKHYVRPPITPEEVSQTRSQLKNKSSGTDGLTAELYKSF